MLATDLVQFALAMIGVIAAAFVALHQPAVGGLSRAAPEDRSEDALAAPGFQRHVAHASPCS